MKTLTRKTPVKAKSVTLPKRPPKPRPPVMLTRLRPAPVYCRIYNASSSRPGHAPHRVVINLSSGGVSCTCERFAMTLRPQAEEHNVFITAMHQRRHCAHIAAAVQKAKDDNEMMYCMKTPYALIPAEQVPEEGY